MFKQNYTKQEITITLEEYTNLQLEQFRLQKEIDFEKLRSSLLAENDRNEIYGKGGWYDQNKELMDKVKELEAHIKELEGGNHEGNNI